MEKNLCSRWTGTGCSLRYNGTSDCGAKNVMCPLDSKQKIHKKAILKGAQILYSCPNCHVTKTAKKRPKCSKCGTKMQPVMR